MRQTFAPNEKKSGQMKFFCAFGAGQREPWSFLQRLTRGIRSSVGILALPFRPLYNNISLLYLLRFLRDSHFKCSRMPVMLLVSVIVSCYKPSHSILNLFELILKTFTRGVPNRTTIFQDWAHQSFICCLFYLLWTRVKISSQETKGPISLSANIADVYSIANHLW